MTDQETASGVDSGRRTFLKLAATVTAAASAMGAGVEMAQARQLEENWDKTFPKSDRVDHKKVSYVNRLGLLLVADLYSPKGLDGTVKHPALVVGTPYGAVKEQASGVHAQAMAERGFVTLAHDPSYVGESGGQPRRTASQEAMVEDFCAGVDFLGSLPFVDRQRIGVIGVCGSGGFSLAAAEIDPRIKAVVTVSMYDIGLGSRQGLSRDFDLDGFKERLSQVADQRWAEVDGAPRAMAIGTPEELSADSSAIEREFFDYYRTPRGAHPRGTTSFAITSMPAMAMFYAFDKLSWLSPRPALFISGDQAHSRHFSELAFEMAPGPKELHWVKGAGHVDLYDRVDLIPFDKMKTFFERSFSAA